jgi:hypothetical protein
MGNESARLDRGSRRAAMGAIVGVVLLAGLGGDCLAWGRSRVARAEFHRAHPCPSTGATRGACPGHVVDHVTPLCAGGPDHPANMQWQTVADAKTKDRGERRLCKRTFAVPTSPS